MAIEVTTASIYVASASSLQAKITRIDSIITALEVMAVDAAATGNFEEYSLDDGQTKIRTVYRNMTDVEAAIEGFTKLKNKYINQLNGRGARLVDQRNIPGCRY